MAKLGLKSLQMERFNVEDVKNEFTRIIGHLKKSNMCCKHMDLNEFTDIWTKIRGRKKIAKFHLKQRNFDRDQFLKTKAEVYQKCVQKQKSQDPKKFLKDQASRKRKCDLQQKTQDPKKLFQQQTKRKAVSNKKKK